ncbi:MAG: START domain-containing protein [Flavobacteriales bacterium]
MKTILLTVLFCFSSALSFAQEGWTLKKDKDGIKAYTKPVEGSAMKAIKATTEFHCSLETCVAVLRDIPHLIELFPDCEKVEKVMQTEAKQIHYLHLKAPWPVADRDATFQLEYSYDSSTNSALVKATTVIDKYPEQKGVVRLTDGGGTWKFTRIDDTHTALDYYYHGNPGGSIPAWLANSVAEENPFKMLQNFHDLVKLGRYQGKTFSFIQ